MEDGCSAQEQVAAAGDEERGRHVVEIGVEGREHGVFRVGAADVFEIVRLWIDDGEVAGKASETVHCLGVTGLAEVAEAGEDAQSGREGELELPEADSDLGGEDGSGGGSVESDAGGFVSFEELAVDGNGVVYRGGKGMFGGEAIEDADDAGVGEVGDGDALGEGARVGVEAAAVDIDEDAVGVYWCGVKWSDVADGNSCDGEGFDVDGISGEGGLACAGLPGVGAFAALGERGGLGWSGLAKGSPGFGAEIGRDRDDAGDAGRSVRIEGAGVGLRRSLLCCERGGAQERQDQVEIEGAHSLV